MRPQGLIRSISPVQFPVALAAVVFLVVSLCTPGTASPHNASATAFAPLNVDINALVPVVHKPLKHSPLLQVSILPEPLPQSSLCNPNPVAFSDGEVEPSSVFIVSLYTSSQL